MRHLGMLFIVVAMGFMSCTQSIHPLFHEKDLVFDERLLGTWGNGKDRWTFKRAVSSKVQKRPSNAYQLSISEQDKVTILQAHIGYIGDYAFFDMFLDPAPDETLPLHFIYRVVVGPDSLVLAFLGEKWFDQLGDAEKARLEIRKFGYREVSLASTDTLQDVLLKHYRDDPTTFQGACVLVRK